MHRPESESPSGWGRVGFWTRGLLAGLLAVLLASSTADALSLRRQCRRVCADEIEACIAAGNPGRECRRLALRACRLGGLNACLAPGESPANARKQQNPGNSGGGLVAPGSVAATALSTSQIDLTWIDTNSRENGYLVERSLDAVTGFALIVSLPRDVETYRNTGLTDGTTYYYRLRATGRRGSLSAYSEVVSATTIPVADRTPPTVPTGLVATPSACNRVDLAWGASVDDPGGSGLRGYNVYRNGALLRQVLAPATTTADTGVAATTSYSYQVASLDNAGNESGLGLLRTATTPACATTTTSTTSTTTTTTAPPTDSTAPSVPTGVTAAAAGCSEVNVSWNPSTDAGGSGVWGYYVYRNGSLAKVVQAPSTSTTDSGLAAATAYSYRISAVDNAGNASALSAPASATTASCATTTTSTTSTTTTRPPTTTTSTTTTSTSTTSTTTTRPPTTTTTSSTTTTTTTRPPTTTTSITTTTTTTSTTTTTPPDTTAPSVPTGVGATAASCSQVNVTWNAATDAGGSGLKGYRVYRNSVYVRQVLVPATSVADTGLAASTVYSYRVASEDNAGNLSAQSATASANTPACPGGGSGSVLWRQRFGGTGPDYGQVVATAANGDVVVAGRFMGTVAFGGGPLTSAGGFDLVLAKYTSAGTHLWSKRFGGAGDEYVRGIALDAGGNIVLTGSLLGTGTLGGAALVSAGSWDIFVAKYDAAGTHLWSQRYGSTQDDLGYGVAVDGAGDAVVTGAFMGRVSVGGALLDVTFTGRDAFVAKYAGATGAHVWSKNFVTTSDDTGYGVAVDGSGNVVVTGYFAGSIDFGGGALLSGGFNDGFLVKLSGAGVHQWSRRLGGIDEDKAYAVAVDGSGNAVVAGAFGSTLNLGGGDLRSAGVQDIFLAKYDAGGAHQWSRRGGGTSYDQPSAVVVDGSGTVVLTGYFQGTADFGSTTLVSAGIQDVVVARWTSAGAPGWAKRFGGPGDDVGYGVDVDGIGQVVVTGYFRDTADFGGATLTSAGSTDAFLTCIEP